jgi:ribosomal protein S8
VASVAPSNISFGSQTVNTPSNSQIITVQNTGAPSLTFASLPALGGQNPGDFNVSGSSCDPQYPSLTTSATCTVTVNFNPKFQGNRSAILTFTDNASNGPTQTVSLLGVGTGPVPNSVIQIAAGSSVAIGSWSADQEYSGGGTYSTTNAIDTSAPNSAPQAVYQNERYGAFSYTLANLTPNATYTVQLHFAEFYYTQPGERQFNMAINGTPVLSNFDIVGEAGGPNIAIVESFTATANGTGQIVVSSSNGAADNPKISGISVTSSSGSSGPAPGSGSSVQIAAGSSAAIGSWSSDQEYSGGGTYSTTSAINTSAPNSAPQAVYQNERYGNFTYTLANLTPNASYTVQLHFAEIYYTQAGQRQFNMAINGTPVLSNFDIVGEAGGPDIAIVKSFTATANSAGQIAVSSSNGAADNPKISGLSVTSSSGSTGPGPGAAVQIDAGSSVAVGDWSADREFSGGGTYSTTSSIDTSAPNSAPAAVYQTERYGTFTYALANLTPNASYTVQLHFAEIYYTQPGQRQFNMAINGAQVLNNFDIVAEAGGPNIAIVKSFTATANSAGQIIVSSSNGALDNPKISGILVQ